MDILGKTNAELIKEIIKEEDEKIIRKYSLKNVCSHGKDYKDNQLHIKYKKVHPLAKDPAKAHETDACWDLFSVEDAVILPGHTQVLSTGLVFDVPPGYCLKDYSRSGLAAKSSVSILNGPGIIDAGYCGEVSMIIHNHGHEVFYAPAGSKLSQVMLEKLLDYTLTEGQVNMDTLRGERGLGSTGV